MRRGPHLTRRHFGMIAGGALASFALGEACQRDSEAQQADAGRLAARPRANVTTSAQGQRALGLGRARDAILRVPTHDAPLPLFVLFHGAGGSGEGVLRRLGSAPDEAGVAVLAPDSRDSS